MSSSKKISIIYKRFHRNKVKNVSDLKDIEWFSLDSNYGEESYGPIIHTYEFKENPKLLNIGKIKVRQMIEKEIVKDYPEFIKISDPNYQYSGGKENYKYHSILKEYFGKEYDGSIIIEDEVDSEDLEGATEIVLWKNFSKILKRV